MKKLTVNFDDLKFDIKTNGEKKSVSIFIFLHGFKSFRNWGFIPYICNQIAQLGYISINLDFSLNGIKSEIPIKFDFEKFARNTISQEVNDVHRLIDYLANSKENEDLQNILSNWNGKIILAGHSRGAGISLIIAERIKQVEKVILLSPISNFNRYTPRMIKKWLDEGYIEFNDNQSGQNLKMNSVYIQDLLTNMDKYDLKKIIEKIDKPILILHGSNDITTPIREAKELYESFQNAKENKVNSCNFAIIDKANHLFNVSHPFNGSNSYLDEVINNIKIFLNNGQN